MFRTALIAITAAAGLAAAAPTPAEAGHWHGRHWGGQGWGGGGYGWRGHGWRGAHWGGPRFYGYRPIYRPYRPVFAPAPAYWGGCRIERRVRYAPRFGGYVVRHVRVCY